MNLAESQNRVIGKQLFPLLRRARQLRSHFFVILKVIVSGKFFKKGFEFLIYLILNIFSQNVSAETIP